MREEIENLEAMRRLVDVVHLRADGLRKAVMEARVGVGGVRADDDLLLAKINDCLSSSGFLVIRRLRSNVSSGSDPWER
jgi:hypothetical protein